VSKLGATRFGNPRSLGPWRAALAAGRFPAAWEETPDAAVRLGETWWLGLRTRAGVEPERARCAVGWTGPDPTAHVRAELRGQGFLERVASGERLTARGWPVADAIARRVIAACSTSGGSRAASG
jgi:coproporphyrinogen III oxidase-like Fe-S oxidoreductase